jgi:TfoX/Sxy family transcriptional regulator of competence genes
MLPAMGFKARRGVMEELAERVRRALGPRPDVVERRMFGGIAFMIRGHMSVGVARGELMVRTGPERFEAALARPHARPMDFTGRPMRGFVFVGRDGIRSDAALAAWIERGVEFAESQPAK